MSVSMSQTLVSGTGWAIYLIAALTERKQVVSRDKAVGHTQQS